MDPGTLDPVVDPVVDPVLVPIPSRLNELRLGESDLAMMRLMALAPAVIWSRLNELRLGESHPAMTRLMALAPAFWSRLNELRLGESEAAMMRLMALVDDTVFILDAGAGQGAASGAGASAGSGGGAAPGASPPLFIPSSPWSCLEFRLISPMRLRTFLAKALVSPVKDLLETPDVSAMKDFLDPDVSAMKDFLDPDGSMKELLDLRLSTKAYCISPREPRLDSSLERRLPSPALIDGFRKLASSACMCNDIPPIDARTPLLRRCCCRSRVATSAKRLVMCWSKALRVMNAVSMIARMLSL